MLVGQLLGLIGIFLLVAVFQVNDRHKLLKLQILSCLTWSVYYVFMGAFTAAGLIFMGAFRSFVFDRFREHEWVYAAVITSYIVATAITWQDWTSAMALIGMTLATTALWQENPRNIRSISLTVTPFWLTYNILNHSYLGAVADLITFTSVLVGIMRFDIPSSLWQRIRRRNTNETFVSKSDIIDT